MRAPLLLDLTHTSHTHARTGIQRVARSLHAALGEYALPITHDPFQKTWRPLEAWERANLAADASAVKRGARWPLAIRIRGRMRRLCAGENGIDLNLTALGTAGLIVPEVFSAATAATLPLLLKSVQGPRVALFHDAIALKYPELTPPKTIARFPSYLVELAAFDGIAAVSEDSRLALVDYWRWAGLKNTPPVITIPLGIDTHAITTSGEISPSGTTITILSVGSIEGRKNHLALLNACEALWSRGEKFSLHLLGLPQPQTAAAALARIRELQAARRPLRYDGPVTDTALAAAYRACTFTVYPSMIEGFGLPVLESVAHGRPCVCSAHGALGESAHGGGCVALERVDEASLAAAIAQLLHAPAEITRLAAAARARRLRTWSDYAANLQAWMQGFPRQ